MKHKNFFIVPNQIFEFGLKPKELAVYCCLLRHSDKNTDNCFPSRRLIAGECSMDKKTVDSALKELEARGLIKKLCRYRENGSRTSNMYYHFAGVWVDEDGLFYCAYECKGGGDTEYGTLENVALATSYDGYEWDKEGVIIYADHESWWQKANVGTPDLYKEGDTWYVFFHGFDFTDCRLGVAYGEDLHNLTIVPEPIIDTEDDTAWSGTIGRRDVIYCDGYYYMVYEISTDQAASGGYGGAQWSHMFARSRDLIEWEITEGPLLTQANTGFGYDGTCWMVVGRHLYVYMRQGGSTTAVELTLAK